MILPSQRKRELEAGLDGGHPVPGKLAGLFGEKSFVERDELGDVDHRVLRQPALAARQGHISRRPGQVHVRVDDRRDHGPDAAAIEGVGLNDDHRAPVTSVAFHPDGALLASASADKIIRLWTVKSGEVTCTITGHTGPVTSVVFSPDGTLLASASADRTVRLWAVHGGTGAPVQILRAMLRQ